MLLEGKRNEIGAGLSLYFGGKDQNSGFSLETGAGSMMGGGFFTYGDGSQCGNLGLFGEVSHVAGEMTLSFEEIFEKALFPPSKRGHSQF